MSFAGSVLLAGRYQLADRIGAGGCGEVWRGTDAVLARPVAIKLLLAGYAQHAETLARFRAEARHAGALSHEGIARIYDYGEPDPPHPPFLVMELVDGPSIAGVLAGGAMEPAQAMDIVAQTATGLQAAHLAGLVHRDIKPGNLLLSRGGVVKITDFGVSHAAGSAPLTSTGMLVGTTGYLAPECVGGARATPASDLYALGVVAYECLAGVAPFTGIPVEVALAHRERPLPALPATVPADIAALVMELTAKDPAARPANAGEVARRAAALRDRCAASAGGQAQGRPDGPPAAAAEPATLTLPPLRRRPVLGGRTGRVAVLAVAAAAAVVLALALASVIGPGAPHGPVSVPSGTSGPASPVAQLVDVNGSSLVGQPVPAVARELRKLGLVVRVRWRPSGLQPAGMVLSVRPGGRVPAGSPVVVTGALRPRGATTKPHDQGDGNGKGKGKGNGKGHGNGD